MNVDTSLLERWQQAANAYFQATDNVEAMHEADVLYTVLANIENGVVEQHIAFYEQAVTEMEAENG